jgi:hypothetical protein
VKNFDRTHLRFFTWKRARMLLRDAGFRILDEKVTVIPVELVRGLSSENFLCRTLNRCLSILTRLLPSLLGYQFIMRAKPSFPPAEHASAVGNTNGSIPGKFNT